MLQLRWVKRFRQGEENVNDHPQSNLQVKINIQLVRQVIGNDPHST